jgi:hypothetical protein
MNPQSFNFRFSLYFCLLIVLGHALAISLFIFLPIPNWAWGGISLLLIFNLVYLIRRDVLLNLNYSYIALKAEKDRWVVFNKQGYSFPVIFQRDSFVTPYLVILNFSVEKQFFLHHIVLMKGSLSVDEFRLLRVMIKWEKVKGSPKSS